MSFKIVNDLLKELGPRDIQQILVDESARMATSKMAAMNVGSLLVIDLEGKLVGIVSERDMVDEICALNRLASDVKVGEIMTDKIEAVGLTTNLRECEERMERLHIRHLPVLDQGKLVGVISIRDLLVSTRAEQEELVRYIRDYTGL